MGSNGSDATFGYAEFGAWYDGYRTDVLEPALDRAMDALQRELDDALSDRDISRIRSLSGRVKSKRRTWRKVSQLRYRPQIATVDDISTVIDDLVGLRLTCTNLRDLEMVQLALENLPRRAGKKRPLGLDPTTERDYVESPKASGYRGWHINLSVQSGSTPVICELQVRTLLQDSWGELTHEDSYSKAGELPPLVEVLSSRMADLLATIDDIAEDLRTELDRMDIAIVAETAAHDDEPGDDVIELGPGADAADILLGRWRSLDRPLELSSLAWALQHEFGAEVSDDWFGYGTFKRFLRAAVPDGEITSGRQAYLLPPGTAPDEHLVDDQPDAEEAKADLASADHARAEQASADQGDASDADGHAGADRTRSYASDAAHDDRADVDADAGGATTIPDEGRELRRIDRSFPLVETDEWLRIYERLAAAWRRTGASTPSHRFVNQLSRSARDSARAAGDPLSRRHVDHVAKAVLATSAAGEPLTADQIGDAFATSVLQRLADLRISRPSDAAARARVGRWLLG